LGSAPSMPATTTMTSAPANCSRCRNRRWMPATPTSASKSAVQPMARAVLTASRATGRSLGPAGLTTTRPAGGPGGAGGRAEGAVVLGLGEVPGQGRRLFGADPGGQAILAGLGQLAHHAFHPLVRLALAEDDFREAAALAAVQIDVGVAQVGHAASEIVRGLI